MFGAKYPWEDCWACVLGPKYLHPFRQHASLDAGENPTGKVLFSPANLSLSTLYRLVLKKKNKTNVNTVITEGRAQTLVNTKDKWSKEEWKCFEGFDIVINQSKETEE